MRKVTVELKSLLILATRGVDLALMEQCVGQSAPEYRISRGLFYSFLQTFNRLVGPSEAEQRNPEAIQRIA